MDALAQFKQIQKEGCANFAPLEAVTTPTAARQLIGQLSATNPEALQAFRQEFDAIVAEYLHDNVVRQEYLLTRAVKC